MTSHRDAEANNRTSTMTSAHSCTCTVHAPDLTPAQATDKSPALTSEQAHGCNSSACRFLTSERSAEQRTEASLRAETSYRDWSEVADVDRPLARTRNAHARSLSAVLKAHHISQRRLAEMLGVDKRQVQKYVEGRSPIPTTLFDALPHAMVDDFANRILDSRRLNAGDRLRAAIGALEQEGASDALILEAFGRLTALRRTR